MTLLIDPMNPPAEPYSGVNADRLSTGQETVERRSVTSVLSTLNASGNLRLNYFTARKSGTVSQVRLITGSTAAGATPTLARVGIYLEAANGDLSLVAATANDTALFSVASATYTKALAAPFQAVRGSRYAVGILVVTAAAVPTFAGTTPASSGGLASSEAAMTPRMVGNVTGQTDLPASIATGSIAASGTGLIYGVLLP